MSAINKYRFLNSKFLFLLLITFSFLVNYDYSNSQELVISEYFNGQTPGDDWTELLVTADNISLEFFVFKSFSDKSGDVTDSWGIQFKQNPLWQNLRSGTIILIHHRGSELIDVNKSDGYIELGSENTTYFTKVNDGKGNWEPFALDIDENESVLQIINNGGYHAHSLSHTAVSNSTYLSLPLPKLNFQGKCPVGESISITPGRNLADYDGEINSARCTVSQSGNYVTKGKPNRRQNFLEDNLRFWQQLRTPNWNNYLLFANIKPDYVELSWTQSSDYVNDGVQGYLILRIIQKDTALAKSPSNGTSYSENDSIGSAVVVANVDASVSSNYNDDFPINCNETYVYRVFAYRYSQDDILGNAIAPSNGRGRTYHLANYAETTVKKTTPAKPTIRADKDKTQICSGDSILITASVFGGPYVYEWILDSQPIPNSNKKTYYAKDRGWYKVKITNEKGCSAESDSLPLNVLPSPTALLYLGTNQIFKDTIITICENESYMLKVSGGNRYEWFKDNVKLSNTTDEQLITDEGLYFAVVINSGMVCTDTSVRVRLNVTHIAYNFDKDTLYFNLDKFTRYEDQAVRISNTSTDTLVFSEIMIPPGGIFSVFVPPPSEIVLPNRSKDYTVRFEPTRSGNFFDSITFILPCKNAIKKVYLFTYKERMNVNANPAIAIFDTLISCKKDSSEMLITITNNENFNIEITEPKTETPFSVITTGFPKTLVSNDSLIIQIKFKTNISNNYTKNLIIPFSANGINDEVLVVLNGKALNSSYKLEFYGEPLTEITFPALTGCEDSTYSAFQVFNTGEIDLEFAVLKDIPGIYLNDLPITIRPGRSKEISVLFVPQQEGIFNETFYLISEPCSVTDSVKLKGSKYGITYGMNKQKVSFDDILNCLNPGIIKDSINLIVSGQSQETPYIAQITGPKYNYFSHNIVQGMTLSDTNKFMIDFIATNIGEYSDTIKILIKPCDIEKVIPLYGNRIEPAISLSTDTLDFNNVAIETRDTNSIIIKNTGKISTTISGIQTLSAPFVLLSSFPVTLDADSSFEVIFEYAPKQIKNDEIKLNLLISEPCDLSYDLWLFGKGDIPKYIATEISVPEISVGELAKEVAIPIYIKALGNRMLDEAKITQIDVSLRYNPTLLYPKKVTAGSAFENIQEINLKFDETPPGLLNINCEVDTSNKIKNGNLFEIKFLALLGNNISSPIIFEKVDIVSMIEIVPDTNRGIFNLIGGCSLDERLLDMEGNFSLSLINGNHPITTSIAEFEVEIPLEANTEFNIYDINGNILATLMRGNYPPGKYFIKLNTGDFSSGTYIAALKQGTIIISRPIYIIR